MRMSLAPFWNAALRTRKSMTGARSAGDSPAMRMASALSRPSSVPASRPSAADGAHALRIDRDRFAQRRRPQRERIIPIDLHPRSVLFVQRLNNARRVVVETDVVA